MMTEFFKRKSLILALLMASLLGPAAYVKGQTAPSASAQVVNLNAADGKKPVTTLKFIRTELYFGSDRPNGPDVTEQDVNGFLDKYVTPEFPDGLTVLTGKGQFCCDAGGSVIRETSFVLILLYPHETFKESSEKIEKIRAAYKAEFNQQSVLRVDDRRPVDVSF
jgi:hypothetical protein